MSHTAYRQPLATQKRINEFQPWIFQQQCGSNHRSFGHELQGYRPKHENQAPWSHGKAVWHWDPRYLCKRNGLSFEPWQRGKGLSNVMGYIIPSSEWFGHNSTIYHVALPNENLYLVLICRWWCFDIAHPRSPKYKPGTNSCRAANRRMGSSFSHALARSVAMPFKPCWPPRAKSLS